MNEGGLGWCKGGVDPVSFKDMSYHNGFRYPLSKISIERLMLDISHASGGQNQACGTTWRYNHRQEKERYFQLPFLFSCRPLCPIRSLAK
jgi:hypothetical protein